MPWMLDLSCIWFRALAYVFTWATWVVSLATDCLYFKLWKSVDIFWLIIHLIISCFFPYLRSDSTPFAIGQFYYFRYFKRKTCKETIREIFHFGGNDEKAKKKRKIAGAISFGIFLLHLRVSIALLLGKFQISHEKVASDPIFAILYKFIFIDVGLLWLQIIFAFWRQWHLCCQLGCVKYYVWVVAVTLAGVLIMELPMYFVVQQLDATSCFFKHHNSTT